MELSQYRFKANKKAIEMIFWKMEIGSSWNDTRGLSIPSYKKLRAWLLDQKHDVEIYTQRPKPIFIFFKR